LGARAKAAGWKAKKGEPDAMRLFRPMLLSADALAGRDPRILAEGAALGRRWLDARGAAEPQARAAAAQAAVLTVGPAPARRIQQERERENDPESRALLVRSLVTFEDPQLVQRGLDYILSPAVNARETYSAYFRIAEGNPRAREIRLDLLDKRFDEILARF